jgi:hypothetical protein
VDWWLGEDRTQATMLVHGYFCLQISSVPGTEGGAELAIEQGKELERDDGKLPLITNTFMRQCPQPETERSGHARSITSLKWFPMRQKILDALSTLRRYRQTTEEQGGVTSAWSGGTTRIIVCWTSRPATTSSNIGRLVMPDLAFNVTGVEAVQRGLTPLLEFRVEVGNLSSQNAIEAILLHAQIQIQSRTRTYSTDERERLVELFGGPENWDQTLRSQFWAHTQAIAPPFSERTEIRLPVPCTYDLNVAVTKFFYALNEGSVDLLFLFTGTIFYTANEEHLHVQRISWEKEATYRLPIQRWRDMMEQHHSDSVWLYLQRGVFDQLYAYKRDHGIATWDQTIERLLPPKGNDEAII